MSRHDWNISQSDDFDFITKEMSEVSRRKRQAKGVYINNL